MRINLTDAAIKEALKNSGTLPGRFSVRDTELAGFFMRVSQGGGVAFKFEYRPRGAGRSVSATTLTIGSWPKLKCGKARKIAEGYAVDVARGLDPAADLRARKAEAEAQAQAVTLADLLGEQPNGEQADHKPADYERALKRRHLVNWRVALSSLRRELKPLLQLEPKAITRRDLARRITDLEEAGKPGAAADLRKFAYSFLEWCEKHDHVSHNVLSGWKRPPKTRAERLAEEPAGRALDDAEMTALWRAAEDKGPPFGTLVRLGLLTGLRRGELANLRWSDIVADRIALAAGATKMGRVHQVPLTPAMRALLATQPKTTSPLVFASPVTGGAIKGWTKLVAGLQAASGVDFTMHDLRRTARTLMSRCGISKEDAELAIGHAREKLEALYNRDEAWQRRTLAFEAVSNYVSALLGVVPGKVVPIRR